MRVHQYIKNLIILLPLFFAGQLTNIYFLLNVLTAFLAFSFLASSVYILNDYLDIEQDKKHPNKRNRPLASGKIPKKMAIIIMFFLMIVGFVLMRTLSTKATIIALIYLLMNIAYSFYLKHIPILDIVTIAVGFILRLFIGVTVISGVLLSKWIVIMIFLLALFLALAKRRDDVLHFVNTGEKMRKVIDGYNMKFIDSTMVIIGSVTIVSYLLYTVSPMAIKNFGTDSLYLTSLFVILGIMRYIQISFVENNSGSPTKILIKDKFTIINLLCWLLSYGYLIYFN